jgi:hypothetical protein
LRPIIIDAAALRLRNTALEEDRVKEKGRDFESEIEKSKED